MVVSQVVAVAAAWIQVVGDSWLVGGQEDSLPCSGVVESHGEVALFVAALAGEEGPLTHSQAFEGNKVAAAEIVGAVGDAVDGAVGGAAVGDAAAGDAAAEGVVDAVGGAEDVGDAAAEGVGDAEDAAAVNVEAAAAAASEDPLEKVAVEGGSWEMVVEVVPLEMVLAVGLGLQD